MGNNSKIPRRFIDLDFNSSDSTTAQSIAYNNEQSIANKLDEVESKILGIKQTARFDITQDDLVGGKFTAIHNFNNLFNHVSIWDEGRSQAFAIITAKNVNEMEINLSDFMPIIGTWTILISEI